jgi:hypothetical protein
MAELPGGQQPGQRGQDRPAGPPQPRSPGLPRKHANPLAQDQDLRVLGAPGPGQQREPAKYPEHCEAGEP